MEGERLDQNPQKGKALDKRDLLALWLAMAAEQDHGLLLRLRNAVEPEAIREIIQEALFVVSGMEKRNALENSTVYKKYKGKIPKDLEDPFEIVKNIAEKDSWAEREAKELTLKAQAMLAYAYFS